MKKIASGWFGIVLWKRILGAMVLGAIFGLLIGEAAIEIRWIGDLFIRMIRMLIVPLVFVTLVAGVIGMGDARRIGSIGARAFGLYILTTIFAIGVGLAFGLILRPGAGLDISSANPQDLSTSISLAERMMAIVPENPFAAFASGDVLAVIFFAILFGAGLILAGDRAKPLADVVDAGAETMLKVTGIVMEFAPFGVFALVAWVMGAEGPRTFVSVFMLAIAVYLGCFLHMALVYGVLLRLLAKLPLGPFFRGVREAQLVAYSMSSSSATLPATLSVAEHNLGIRGPVASSVLPLGATVNMDGTALYVALLTVFSAQIFGVPLDLADYGMITLVTVLVSIGTASVPSASLFLLAAVLETVGMTPAQTALVVGFILPFDRILDMMRTVVNITGDLTVATIVAKWEDELDEEIYRAKPVE